MTVNLLPVRSEEEVVGRVGHELGLTHRARGGWNRSSSGVQTLDEGGFGQEVAARASLEGPDFLQQEALNRAGIRATCGVSAGVDSVLLYHPHPAAIEGTLPRRVSTERGRDAIDGVQVDALKVRDELKLLELIGKKSGFGTGSGVPGSATVGRWEASIALAAEGVADQICRVSYRYGNGVGNGRGRDLLRRDGDRAECTCEHESGPEQVPNSRSNLLTTVITH